MPLKRSGERTSLLILLLIIGGVGCLWLGDVQFESLSSQQAPIFTAAVMFFLATCAGLLTVVTMRAGQRHLVHSIDAMLDREKEILAMKNDFVSSVSHELRTPLASIAAYTEMLIDGEVKDDRTAQEFYDIIQNEANRLSRLIDNILNLSRIESGIIRINQTTENLNTIVQDALVTISPQASLKKLEIDLDLDTAAPVIRADRDMIYQAVLNLLTNAVKYTSPGGTISVVTEVDEHSKKAICRILDSGAGIEPKDLPFVFDKFFRAEANQRLAKGTGLGLSLVKHIVETVHRGRVFAQSEVGKGSCFGFELDLLERSSNSDRQVIGAER
jgi:two-component system phosphate regulon sensor histidine kinase PhoR